MIKSSITASFPCDIQVIWDIVTDNSATSWRSDLSKTEIIDERNFVEYTKDGFPTKFTITKMSPCERYEFDMENKNMKGHWIGQFRQSGQDTVIEFTEEVSVHNPIMRLFAKGYLRKQQNLYAEDLRKRIENR